MPKLADIPKSVEPTNSLGINPMPCEHKAAHIYNQAQHSIKDDDLPRVGMRYLQARAGANRTRNHAIAYTLTAGFSLMSLIRGKNFRVMHGLVASFCAANVPPNVSNTKRYRTVQQFTGKHLEQALTPDHFSQVDTMGYSRWGLKSLARLFHEQGMDASAILDKASKIKQNNSPVI